MKKYLILIVTFMTILPSVIFATNSIESAAELCNFCHGSAREVYGDKLAPRLDGINLQYAIRVLDTLIFNRKTGYASTEKRNYPPSLMPTMLSDRDRAIKILKHFAKLPIPAPSLINFDTDKFVAGKKIAQEQCASCHGLDGYAVTGRKKRKGFIAHPNLFGLRKKYIIQALQEHLRGERTGIMTPIVREMTQKEIDLVSEYYAGQKFKKWVKKNKIRSQS